MPYHMGPLVLSNGQRNDLFLNSPWTLGPFSFLVLYINVFSKYYLIYHDSDFSYTYSIFTLTKFQQTT